MPPYPFPAPPEPHNDNSNKIASICQKIFIKNEENSIFKNFTETNDKEHNLLIFYLANTIPHQKFNITNKDLEFIIDHSDINQTTKLGNTALSVAISNSKNLNHVLSTNIMAKLMTSKNIATINEDNQTPFEIACLNYKKEKLPLSIEQFGMLYTAHKIIRPSTDGKILDEFVKILDELNQEKLNIYKKTEIVENYLNNNYKPGMDENAELKYKIKELEDKINIIEKQLATNGIFLSISDKPGLDTQNKLGNAIKKLTLSKAEEIAQQEVDNKEDEEYRKSLAW